LGIGLGPPWLKGFFVRPDDPEALPALGFVYGTARELGGGFVPLQMIALGVRLVNVASDSGPLGVGGAAGPNGRSKLLRIGAAVGIARMVLAPAALYGIMVLTNGVFKARGYGRPFAFWAPALIVAAMPTANNMSTMADLIGSGRSISAASIAMQLLVSPIVLAISLTLTLAGAAGEVATA